MAPHSSGISNWRRPRSNWISARDPFVELATCKLQKRLTGNHRTRPTPLSLSQLGVSIQVGTTGTKLASISRSGGHMKRNPLPFIMRIRAIAKDARFRGRRCTYKARQKQQALRFVQAVERAGGTLEDATDMMSVHRQTLRSWLLILDTGTPMRILGACQGCHVK